MMGRRCPYRPPILSTGRNVSLDPRSDSASHSVHAHRRPGGPGGRRFQPGREAEAAGDPEVEAGQVMHLPRIGANRVDLPVAAAREGDEAGFPEWLVADSDVALDIEPLDRHD
jgi:hypothetical protein